MRIRFCDRGSATAKIVSHLEDMQAGISGRPNEWAIPEIGERDAALERASLTVFHDIFFWIT
jgi:hypothetical protein